MVRLLAGRSCECCSPASVEAVGARWWWETGAPGWPRADWYAGRNSRNRGVAGGDWQESERWESRDHLVRRSLERASASDAKEWRGDGGKLSWSGGESRVGTGLVTWSVVLGGTGTVCRRFTSCAS